MDKERDSLYDDELNAADDAQEETADAFDDYDSNSEEAYSDDEPDEGYDDAFDGDEADSGADATDAEEAEGADDEDDMNDTTYFMRLFDFLTKALQSGTNVPLTTKKLVDTEECFKILDDMQRNLPDAIQYGWKIYAEKDRILDKAENVAKAKVTSTNVRAKSIIDDATAKADGIVESAQRRARATVADAEERANAMLDDAAQRAKRMVNESEIMQRAKSEAAIIIENARAEAHERRLKAVNDAYRLLEALEKQANGISDALNRKKNELVGGNR